MVCLLNVKSTEVDILAIKDKDGRYLVWFMPEESQDTPWHGADVEDEDLEYFGYYKLTDEEIRNRVIKKLFGIE